MHLFLPCLDARYTLGCDAFRLFRDPWLCPQNLEHFLIIIDLKCFISAVANDAKVIWQGEGCTLQPFVRIRKAQNSKECIYPKWCIGTRHFGCLFLGVQHMDPFLDLFYFFLMTRFCISFVLDRFIPTKFYNLGWVELNPYKTNLEAESFPHL